MTTKSEIKTDKSFVKDVFKKWFRIPEYQRPYVWGSEEVDDLIEDINYASINSPDGEYFLGSIVYQHRPANEEENRLFEENDLLDGQQRLTSLLLLMAVIRDLPATEPQRKETCTKYIFQQRNLDENTPERLRILFDIRDDVKTFINDYVNLEGGTAKENDLRSISSTTEDISIRNMSKAILQMRQYFLNDGATSVNRFFPYLLTKVLLVSVSTEDLEDAFRLFTVLNARGVPLRNSDILKAWNLGVINSPEEKIKYARMWEEMESEYEEDFDRFLSYVRTILVKEKARLSLIKEFETNIYHPKLKPPLLKKGKETFDLLDKYRDCYNYLFSEDHSKTFAGYSFDNLLFVMSKGHQSTDWMPPLMSYYHRFKDKELLSFLVALDRKFSADLVNGESPTKRIENMNNLLRAIESADSLDQVLASDTLKYEKGKFMAIISGDIYGRKVAKYLLLKMDYYLMDQQQKFLSTIDISIEHVLPQTPKSDSQWVQDFNLADRTTWTNKMGNLVLISGPKNSSQGRLDYSEKKAKYFQKRITIFPNSLRVMQQSVWTPTKVQENQATVLESFEKQY